MSDYIPMDLMPEILKWLPVKSLVRFRSVRRSWNHLITSPFFIAAHLACSSMKPRLLLGYDHDEPPKYKELMAKRYFLLDSKMLEVNARTLLSSFEMISFDVFLWTHDVVGSVNGVLCLTDWRLDDGIVLWNPLIRKYIPLPRDSLSFRDWGCDELLGFGVNESEDDFRVIRVSYIRVYEQSTEDTLLALWAFNVVEEYFMVEVCSARDRIWRALNADILENCQILKEKQVPQCLVNGVVHWIVRVSPLGSASTKTLLCFDFDKEVLGYLSLPEKLANSYYSNSQVQRFGGMLGVLECDWPYCGIWAMSEYGDVSSWSFIIKVYTICLARELKERVMGLTEGGQILITEGDDYDPYGGNLLFFYNPANGTRRQLHFEEKITSIHAPDFVESLIFMDNESGAVSLPAIQFNVAMPGSP